MTIDEQDEVYKKGFNAGVEHQNMSPDTRDSFTTIQKELSRIQLHAAERAKDIEFIKSIVERIEENMVRLTSSKEEEHKILSDRIGKVEMQVAKLAIYWTVILGVAGFLGQLLSSYLSKKF